MKTTVISGINGQDGSYLADLCIGRGDRVIGIERRASTSGRERIRHLEKKIEIVEGDISDFSSVSGIVCLYKPDEFYNTAAQSHVATSFDQPLYTMGVNTGGVLNILECIRQFSPKTRLLQCSTSEMFGNNFDVDENGIKYQGEETQLKPASPYGVSKAAAHQLVDIYRKSYGLHVSSAITFNHESPRRGENFVTRKITRYLGGLVKELKANDLSIKSYKLEFKFEDKSIRVLSHNSTVFLYPYLELGNLDASRDWGFAEDYCKAFMLMLEQEQPGDYVLCTEQTHTVREFLNCVFSYYNLDYKPFVKINPKFFRPLDVEYLNGRSKKIKELGWEPETSFEQLVKKMVMADAV